MSSLDGGDLITPSARHKVPFGLSLPIFTLTVKVAPMNYCSYYPHNIINYDNKGAGVDNYCFGSVIICL